MTASGARGQAGHPAGDWAARAGRLLAAAARPVVSARTWLAVIHLLAGTVIGLAAFVVVVIGAALGVGLLPLFLVGAAVLAATCWLCMQLARAERARFALLLDERILPPPPQPADVTGWRRVWRTLTGLAALRQYAYALLRLPVSAVEAAVLLAAWSLALALAALPGYAWALPRNGNAASFLGLSVRGPATQAAAAVAGLALLCTAPWLTWALAAADAAAARWLLGSLGQAELTTRIGELERSRADVVDAAGAERRRLERDLHDGAQQRLVSLAMELGRARAKFETDPQAAEVIVGQAHEQAKAALTELRSLVRGMHPPVLTDRGLDAALSGLAALSPVPAIVRVDLPARPPAGIEAIAYFVVAEALTNVAKHARASQAEVTVDMAGEMLRVVISDDGAGGADPAGQGLSGLASRAAAVDGRLSVSSPPGGPTSIEVLLPCGS